MRHNWMSLKKKKEEQEKAVVNARVLTTRRPKHEPFVYKRLSKAEASSKMDPSKMPAGATDSTLLSGVHAGGFLSCTCALNNMYVKGCYFIWFKYREAREGKGRGWGGLSFFRDLRVCVCVC